MSIPLTRGRQACLAIGMIVMLGAAALAVALLLTINQRDPALEFEALFRDALARGSTDDSFPVARFARRYDVCAYGASDPLTERRVARFFELVRNETWMQPNLSFRAKVSECPETTFFYIFHHDGEGGSARATLDDLMFITARHDMALPADHLRYIPAHLPGFVVTLGVPGKPPRIFSAINGFPDAKSETERILARTVLQQELFQAVLVARDLEVKRRPVSIVEEWNISTTLRNPLTDPQYAARWLKHNVHNMCLYDIMLLITLYAWDEAVLEGKLGPYIRYIRNHYDEIEKRARAIQQNPGYSDLFPEKC